MSVNTDGGTSDPIRPDLSHVHILFDLLSNVGPSGLHAMSQNYMSTINGVFFSLLLLLLCSATLTFLPEGVIASF